MLDYYLQNETKVYHQTTQILHFAPEKLLEQKLKAAQKSNYISADINPAFADMVIDIQAIPFKANSFDLIICAHVLGHVPDEKKAIDEMYRVLKPGGSAIILTVLDFHQKTYENHRIKTPEERLRHFGESDLLRLHGTDFIQRLERDIVSVKQIDYSQHFSEEEKKKFGLGNRERELIFNCTKLA
jgi:ubiquinone/menaquinone biosynthesis C-methylase UbiE